ncbi:MAG TPA: hypothetical protein VL651_09465 [Bacteroidia bacterium]|jgi:Spy/CpxP family protein refolding chaperone|nr:hypothetical protein [Bacteroidia bacterium]
MKRILCISILALFSTLLSAQTGTDTTAATATGAERVQSLRVAYFTKRLDLTAAEAQKFWPVYNEYQDKRDAVRKAEVENRKKIMDGANTLSDDSLTKLADEEIRLRQEDMRLQAELNEKLKPILPPKKLALLYVAEDEFKKVLLNMLTQDANPKGTKGPK